MFNSVNTCWTLVGAFLVYFMQAGFALCEAGFTRAKNTGNILMKNMMDFCIGPYNVSANPYCPVNFNYKAILPQSFKGNRYQIWSTVTGGAYHSARRVTMCVRND